MKLPKNILVPTETIEVTFRGMAPSTAVEAAITHWVSRLHHVHVRIQRCHVWIAVPHRHRRRGASFQVRLAVGIPGAQIAVTGEDADVSLALADAFLAVRRQLQDHAQIRRGEVKRRAAHPKTARAARLPRSNAEAA